MLAIRFIILIASFLFLISCEEEVSRSPEYMPPGNAKIFVDSYPHGAKIFLNGKFTGDFTPDSLTFLRNEQYQIMLRKEFFRDTIFTVDLTESISLNKFIDYSANARMLGKISFKSNPEGSTIKLNDSLLIQTTPFTSDRLLPGKYTVEYSFPEHRIFKDEFIVESDQITEAFGVLPDTSLWVFYNIQNSDFPSNHLRQLAVDSKNNVWIASNDAGLIKFDGVSWENFNSSNSDVPYNVGKCVVVDNSDNVWFGTEQGLVKFSNGSFDVFTADNSILPVSNILSLESKNGIVWVGTAFALVKIDGSEWSIFRTSNSGLASNYIQTIHADAGENVWIGSSNFGISELSSNGTWSIFNKTSVNIPGNNISSITSRNNEIWFGHTANSYASDTGLVVLNLGGVAKYDGTNWTKDFINLPVNSVNSIHSQNNLLWVGTSQGLVRFESGISQLFNTTNSDIGHNVVFDIDSDGRGIVWIASFGGGLIKYKGEL